MSKSEHKYMTLLEHLPQRIFLKDKDSVYVSCNEIYARDLKIKADEIAGKTDYDLFPKEVAEKHVAQDKKCLETGKIVIEDVSSLQKGREGISEWLHIVKTPAKDEKGNIVGILGIYWDVTERKLAEDALRESEEKYRTLVKNIPQGIFVRDKDSVYVSCNENFARDFKIKADEIAGKTPDDFFSKELAEKYRADDKRVMESGKTEVIEERRVQNGREMWQNVVKAPAKDEKGNIVGILGIYWDITERKLAEDRVKHLNAVLLAIRNVNQLIVREKDRDQLLQSACDSLAKTRGFYNAWIALMDESGGLVTTAESGVGEDFSLVVEQLKRRELTDCARGALSQSEIWISKDPSSTCSKCPIAAKCSGKWVMAARLEHGGKVYGMLTVSVHRDFATDEEEQTLFKDIVNDIGLALHGIELEGERKRAEEALRESEEKYRMIVETMSDGLSMTDKNAVMTYANDRLCQILGYSRDEILGRPIDDFFGEANKSILKEQRAKRRKGERSPYEIEWTRKEGRKVPTIISPVPIFDADGKFRGSFAVVTDITERKNAEKKMREFIYKVNNISHGKCYLHKSSDAAYNIFTQLVLHGVPGLCITREKPDDIIEYGIPKENIILLSSTPLKGFNAVGTLQDISLVISDFLKKHEKPIVMLDGLAYMKSRFDFKSVYKFIQEKRFKFIETSATLLMPVDLATLTENERALLTSEVKLLG